MKPREAVLLGSFVALVFVTTVFALLILYDAWREG